MSNDDDWSRYNRGMMTAGTVLENPFATGAEARGRDTARAAQGGGGGGAGGAGGGVAIVFLLALLVIVPALVAALPGALVLLLVTRLVSRRSRPAYRELYLPAAWAIGLFFLVTAIVTYGVINYVPPAAAPDSLIVTLWMGVVQAMMLTAGPSRGPAYPPVEFDATLALGMLVLYGPGLLAFAATLHRMVGYPYAGLRGLPRSLLAGAVTMATLGVLAWAVALYVAPHAEPLHAVGVNWKKLVWPALAGLVLMAGAGGVVLTLLLRAFAARRPFHPGISLGIGAMALSTACALFAFYLFRQADPFFFMLWRMAVDSSPSFTGGAGALAYALLAAPGVAVGAVYVTARAPAAYGGLGGFVRALAATGIVTLGGLAPVLLVVALLFSGR